MSPPQSKIRYGSLCTYQELHSLAETESNDDTFLPWLEQKAEMKISSVLSIGESSIGRYSHFFDFHHYFPMMFKQFNPISFVC